MTGLEGKTLPWDQGGGVVITNHLFHFMEARVNGMCEVTAAFEANAKRLKSLLKSDIKKVT